MKPATFLFCSVAVSGVAIITKGVPFNRRNRFILTAGLAIGYGATLVPTYFHQVFKPVQAGRDLRGFLNAVELVMETGFFVAAIICMVLNLALPEEIEDTQERVIPASEASAVVDARSATDEEEADSARGIVPEEAKTGRATSDDGVEKAKNN
jgi:xanthine/uracil permease